MYGAAGHAHALIVSRTHTHTHTPPSHPHSLPLTHYHTPARIAYLAQRLKPPDLLTAPQQLSELAGHQAVAHQPALSHDVHVVNLLGIETGARGQG